MHQLFKLRTGDLDVDRPPAADALLKQARLLGHGDCARQVAGDPADQWHQLGRRQRVDRPQPDEDTAITSHKEEVAENWCIKGGGLGRVRIDVPVRNQPLLHPLAQPDQFIEVVTRRRQQDAEDQVTVALGQILNLWQHGPGGENCRSDNCHGRYQLPERLGQQELVEPKQRFRK